MTAQVNLIGLTGGIACGKSSATQVLAQLGAVIIDADVIARQIVAPGSSELARIEREIAPLIGQSLIDGNGELKRAVLNEAVFADAALRRKLEGILHPSILREIRTQASTPQPSGHGPVILSAPLLYETGLDRQCRAVLVITCSPDVQRQRLQVRDGLQPAQAQVRIDSQMPLDEKKRRATWVIDNDGDLNALRRQIEALYPTLSAIAARV